MALVESSRAICAADLDRLAEGGRNAELAAYARRIGILPEKRPEPRLGAGPSKPGRRRAAADRESGGDDSAAAARSAERQERGEQR